MCQLICHMQTNRINENIDHYWVTKALTIGIYHLNFPILISKNQLKLLYNASIFYYDAKLGVNVIMLEPLNQPFFFGRIYLCVCIYMIHIYIYLYFIYIYIYIYIYIPLYFYSQLTETFCTSCFLSFYGKFGMNIMNQCLSFISNLKKACAILMLLPRSLNI